MTAQFNSLVMAYIENSLDKEQNMLGSFFRSCLAIYRACPNKEIASKFLELSIAYAYKKQNTLYQVLKYYETIQSQTSPENKELLEAFVAFNNANEMLMKNIINNRRI